MDQHYLDIITDYINAYNSFDVEGMCRHLSEGMAFENYSDDALVVELSGKAAFAQQAKQVASYFKQRYQTIKHVEQEGNILTVWINYEAILAKDFPDGMKAGDTLTLEGLSKFTIENGQIKKIQDYS